MQHTSIFRTPARQQSGIRDLRSGQVLLEAVFGLALLAFVWALIAFSTFSTTNHVRTAMAARHAAWQKGNGLDPSVDDIEKKFFYQTGLLKVETGTGPGIGSLINGANVADLQQFSGGDKGPFVAKVTFGLTSGEINSATTFPFTLMTTKFPLMPPTLLKDFLQVESSCQWDEVGDAWSDWKKALKGVMSTFEAESKGFLGNWVKL